MATAALKLSRPAKPLRLRTLKAAMAMKGIDLKTLARIARVSYPTASQVLNGHWISPVNLSKLERAVASFPMPK
jgi:lambda repressor-like predicted transcriptional regulator